MSNFTMGKILGKGLAQPQVHTNPSTIAEGTSAVRYARAKAFPKIVPMAKLHSLIVILIKKCVIKSQIALVMSTMGK